MNTKMKENKMNTPNNVRLRGEDHDGIMTVEVGTITGDVVVSSSHKELHVQYQGSDEIYTVDKSQYLTTDINQFLLIIKNKNTATKI